MSQSSNGLVDTGAYPVPSDQWKPVTDRAAGQPKRTGTSLAVSMTGFGGERVEPSLVDSLVGERAGCDASAQDTVGLIGAEPAELGHLLPGNPTARPARGRPPRTGASSVTCPRPAAGPSRVRPCA